MIGQYLVVEIVSIHAKLVRIILLVLLVMKCLICNLMGHAQTNVFKDHRFGTMSQRAVFH